MCPEEGWLPLHLSLWREDRLIAAAPAYLKGDSMGDFSRDWSWAGAFRRAGLSYYPKLVIGVPFTPVVGRRFFVAQGEDEAACVATLARLALRVAAENEVSSVQVLYCTEAEQRQLAAAGFHPRLSFQFHWFNDGFGCREDFLATLKSKRRTQLRREWRAPAEQGVTIRTLRGDALAADPERWADHTYEFYKQTVHRYMWRDPYLKRSFYRRLFEEMPEHVEVVTATEGDRLLAGAFNVAAPGRLWGRYWGCFEERPFLHFNVCLYHTIDEAIARGVQVFEGGEGGHHKLQRGFAPGRTFHAFAFLDPRMDVALGRYLEEERQHREAELRSFLEAS